MMEQQVLPPVECISTEQDIAVMRTTELADYHFAVTALQLDGSEVYLSDIARNEATRSIDRTHHTLLLASGDAMTKELLPGSQGFTAVDGGPSYRPEVFTAANDEVLREKYLPYAIDVLDEGSRVSQIGEPMTELLSGMRQALYIHRDNPAMVRDIVRDIARTTREVFAEHRKDCAVRGQKIERGWLEFTDYAERLVDAEQDGSAADRQIAATIVINAVHNGARTGAGNGSIMERMTTDEQLAGRLVKVLNATRGSYDDLLPHTGYAGGMLYMYLTGKRKSLGGLAAGQAVPGAFTSLLG
jgi:hypothetical protein